ncbi:hypothetical protein MTO96_002470 [Rhipicephalus appendiculatus]
MIKLLRVTFCLASLLNPSTITGSAATEVAEQAMLPPAALMRYFGYNVEVHNVTTADGYILEVDRMRSNSTTNLPDQSPGFLLADAGFDVWLVNTRGVPQSNRHVNLTTNDTEFWKWSFEQIGTYDLPAVIDYILNKTNFTKVGLLTTSQGTTASLVLLSMLPEYNEKVNILVGYAPVANVTHFTSPMRLLIPFSKLVKAVNDFFTHGGFLVSNDVRQKKVAHMCDYLRDLCYKPLAFLYGKNPKQYNSTRVPVYVANLPVGSSSQNVPSTMPRCTRRRISYDLITGRRIIRSYITRLIRHRIPWRILLFPSQYIRDRATSSLIHRTCTTLPSDSDVSSWLFLLLSPLTTSRTAATDVSDEAILDPAGVMMYYGNDVEVHRVVTTDGFILEVDRLLPRSSNGTAPKRTPMLLVHGLLVNSVSWVSNLPSQSPDAGYDVWLMNTRGVPQSNYHVTLSTNDPAFWKWSFEEIGMYDLPATVDYILNETGFSKLGLLAASQGGTAVLVFLSMLPEYNDKASSRELLCAA